MEDAGGAAQPQLVAVETIGRVEHGLFVGVVEGHPEAEARRACDDDNRLLARREASSEVVGPVGGSLWDDQIIFWRGEGVGCRACGVLRHWSDGSPIQAAERPDQQLASHLSAYALKRSLSKALRHVDGGLEHNRAAIQA